jgi:hypothetical protein
MKSMTEKISDAEFPLAKIFIDVLANFLDVK